MLHVAGSIAAALKGGKQRTCVRNESLNHTAIIVAILFCSLLRCNDVLLQKTLR